ncbi:cytochrome P450 [Nocardioides sp. GY 10113]|uniref:cytochrome P450 n=1 Tax=Nocardioides sp. GY 10113 TaxID=2569761 RepID=UPI0010A89396|nr:cytochrome P450 [Nocardioides sp. GY 10113]TIC84885.1 cytochrome P450 [Nocardioides sp. GY 10113]
MGALFDPFSEEYFADPYPAYRRLRDEAPVYYNAERDFYALSRYDDVAPAQKDFATYSSAYGVDVASVHSGRWRGLPMMIMMDPPEHRRMRALVNKVFTPRAIAALEPMARETIGGFLAECDPAGFDGVADFAALFPVEIISRMLGIPEGERQQIRHWLDAALHREPGEEEMGPAGERATAEMGAYFLDLIGRRRSDPQPDMITALVEAEVARDEDGASTRLDDLEITSFLSLLGGAGAETVTKLVGGALVALADHPDQWAALREDRSRIPAAVEEALRFDAPAQYNVRRSMREVRLHGVTIPEGSAVMLLVGSANRDERAFADPDRFDIDRPVTGRPNIGFGYGVHSCLGAALARMESRIALELLLDLVPRYDVDREGLRRVSMSNVAGYASVPVRAV